MRYAVIIPVLNPGERLPRLIDALLAQTAAPEEIIVVDSASEDGAPQRAAGKDRVRLIPIRREAFDHGGTRDLALRESTGDIVVFMTQDAVPADEHLLENLIRYMMPGLFQHYQIQSCGTFRIMRSADLSLREPSAR